MSSTQPEIRKKRSWIGWLIAAVVVVAVAVWAIFAFVVPQGDAEDSAELSTPFTVAAVPVPHAEILEFVRDELADDAGISFDVETFTDYPLGNRLLADGDVDANYFQHQPYEDAQVEEFGYELSSYPGIHIEPYAAFSDSLGAIDELAEGGTIGITNDPSNQSRALILLSEAGLIELPEGDEELTVLAVDNPENNPSGYAFQETDAAQLSRALPDVDLAILNGNYFLDAGLTLTDALLVESIDENPYSNFLTVREGEQDDPRFVELNELLHSPETKAYIEENWPGGDVYPAF